MARLLDFLAGDRAIYFLVGLFVLLGTLYSVTTPVFEAGDELWHYPHVQWLARGNGLPVQDPTQVQLWEQEGGQPPLYYATAAAATFWIDTSDLEARLWRNPYAQIGVPLAFGNKNMVVHTNAEAFPWRGTTLAIHLIRLLSVLFSAGTVFLTYKLAQEVQLAASPTTRGLRFTFHIPTLLALIAASIVAFNPMFLFISASVNNDSLAALLATAAVFLSMQLLTRGATNRRVLLLGIVIGFAILTKVSNLALVIVALAVIAACAWQEKKIISFLRPALILSIPVILLAGWWFARNYFLYGDPLAFNVWLQIAGGRQPQTLAGLLSEFQGFRISFWGNFGGVNIIAPEWVYTVLDLFTLLALGGLTASALRRTLPGLLWVPALQLAVVFIALIRWTWLTYASQGRLMFPAIAAAALLVTFGLYELANLIAQTVTRRAPAANTKAPLVLPALLSMFLLLFALAAPVLVIAPTYALPPRGLEEAQVPNPVHIQYGANGGQPELVGFESARFLEAGQALPLKLYWRTAAPVTDDLALYIHVYDTRGELLGQWDAYPGNGLYPPALWQFNEIIADEYRVPVQIPQNYPPLGRIEVGLTRVGSPRVLPARNPQGETITPSLAQFKFSQPALSPRPALFLLGDEFNMVKLGLQVQRGMTEISPELTAGSLLSLKPGDALNVEALLQARRIPANDYVLFAHIVDGNGKIIAQMDAQPVNNSYPTSFWNVNEEVASTLTMDLPRDALGAYTLEFGVYNGHDLRRLPISGVDSGYWRAQGDHLTVPLEIAP